MLRAPEGAETVEASYNPEAKTAGAFTPAALRHTPGTATSPEYPSSRCPVRSSTSRPPASCICGSP